MKGAKNMEIDHFLKALHIMSFTRCIDHCLLQTPSTFGSDGESYLRRGRQQWVRQVEVSDQGGDQLLHD